MFCFKFFLLFLFLLFVDKFLHLIKDWRFTTLLMFPFFPFLLPLDFLYSFFHRALKYQNVSLAIKSWLIYGCYRSTAEKRMQALSRTFFRVQTSPQDSQQSFCTKEVARRQQVLSTSYELKMRVRSCFSF